MSSAWMVLFLAISASAVAQDDRLEKLSPEHRKWLEEEVVYIISDRERDLFLSLETLQERESFIEAFWKKRDPNRATPQNEFKEEHYRRIEYANEFLGREAPLPGWKSDQGKMYIILGEPVEIQRFEGYQQMVPTQMWFYQSDPQSGLPPFFYLLFFREHEVGQYQLYSPVADGPKALLTGRYFTSDLDDLQALSTLREISPELARTSLSFDPSDPGDVTTGRPSLGVDPMISRIYESPTRAIRSDYIDAYLRYGHNVAADYSFNYVPNRSVFAVLAGPEATPFVHYSVELDAEDFTLETDEDRTEFYTTVDVTVEVKDQDGGLVVAADQEIFIELTRSEAEKVGTSPFAFQEAMPLVPGEYNVSVLLKNRVLKQYTVAEENVRIESIRPRVPWLSDVLLGYRSEDTGGKLAETDPRPFRIGYYQIHPAADGAFPLGETVQAFLQVLGAGPDYRLDFALLNGQEKIQERSLLVGDCQGGPAHESFALIDMAGGWYVLRVQLLDPAGNLVAERSTNVQVSPRSAIPRPGFHSRRSFDAAVPGLLSLTRGEQLMRLKRVEEARIELEKAVAANNPGLPEARWELAWLLIQPEPERAMELLTPLESGFPNQYEVVAGIGFASYFNYDFSTAADYLERAMTIQPPDTTLLNALGDSWERLGELENARAAFERSLELQPGQKKILERLASLGKAK